MRARVAGGKIASRRRHEAVLAHSVRRAERDPRALAIAGARDAHQPQGDPVPARIRGVIVEHARPAVQHAQHDIDIPVVVEVSESRAAAGQRPREDLPRGRGNVLESPVRASREQRRLAIAQARVLGLDRVEHMALRGEDVFPAVEIQVGEADAPARHRRRDGGEPALPRPVGEETAAFVAVQGVEFLGEVGDQDVRAPIVVVVLEIDAHPREPAAVLVVRDAAPQAAVLEDEAALVAKQLLRLGIVGEHDIDVSVPFQIVEGHAQRLARQRGQAGRFRHVLEPGAAAVRERHARDRTVADGRAVPGPRVPAGDMTGETPVEVAGDDQIQQAIRVEVGEARAGRPAGDFDPAGRGRIDEGSASGVAEEPRPAVAGDQQVSPSVVVVVPGGGSHAVDAGSGLGDARLACRVAEGAVAVVAIEAIAQARIRPIDSRRCGRAQYGPAVDEQDVEPAILVEVQQGDAAAHRLEEVFRGGRAGVVAEIDACLLGSFRQGGRRGGRGRARQQGGRHRPSAGAPAPRARAFRQFAAPGRPSVPDSGHRDGPGVRWPG